MIEARALSKVHGHLRAVDRISFEVRQGEIMGFLGPNGAGKTTTLRILTCFAPATSGQALIAGHDVTFHHTEGPETLWFEWAADPPPDLKVIHTLWFAWFALREGLGV